MSRALILPRRATQLKRQPDTQEATTGMEPITKEATRGIDQALERWTRVEQQAPRPIDDADLRDVGLDLASAIQLVPLDWPSQPADDVIGIGPNLRKQINHLALVARALRGLRHGGTVSHDPTPLHFQGRRGRGLFRVNVTYLEAGCQSER